MGAASLKGRAYETGEALKAERASGRSPVNEAGTLDWNARCSSGQDGSPVLVRWLRRMKPRRKGGVAKVGIY